MEKVIQNLRTTIACIIEHEHILTSDSDISPIDVVRKLAEYIKNLEKQDTHTQKIPYDTLNYTAESNEKDEINKVRRKLPKWHTKPHQINSQIVQAYLDYEQQTDYITKQQFREYCEKKGIQNFDSNFPQMCNISPKNHGKVFDIKQDGEIVLWEPVAEYIKKVWQWS